MRVLRYLTGDILQHTLAVSVVLFLVVFSGRFIRYLAEAAIGDITSDVLLPVMLYKLPSFFELILPLSLFVGILLSLGRLYAESEMIVLKACGVSPTRLAMYLMVPAMLITLSVAALSLVLAPGGSARAQALLDNPRSAEGLQQLAAGRFKKQRDGRLVSYAERIDAAGVMYNVFLVERGEAGAGTMTVTLADEGQIIFDAASGRRYLELRRGTRYKGSPGTRDYEVVRFGSYGELIPEPEGGIRATVKADAIPTQTLLASAAPRDRATLAWRLSLPLLVPIVTIIALSLSRTDARRGRYARLGPALLVFLAYFLGLTQTRGWIEHGGPAAAIWSVHAVFALLALVLLHWERLSRQWGRRRAPA